MNKRGTTLIELLAVLTIIGILAPLVGKLFVNLNGVMKRAEKIQQNIVNIQKDNIRFASNGTCVIGTILICFDNGKAIGCDTEHPCFCENNQWKRNNGVCSDGVLLK